MSEMWLRQGSVNRLPTAARLFWKAAKTSTIKAANLPMRRTLIEPTVLAHRALREVVVRVAATTVVVGVPAVVVVGPAVAAVADSIILMFEKRTARIKQSAFLFPGKVAIYSA
jgi:hypothetical protein